MFSIEFSGCAKRFLKKLDKTVVTRIIERIEPLSNEPFPPDVKRIVNKKEKIFRIRVGDYRIQYLVIYDSHLVFISDIDKRESAYD
jgi:mRNA interferase RelE/StbE